MASVDQRPPTELEKVEGWRELQLIRGGYPAENAIELARLPHVDVHQAVDLLASDCTLETALKILR